MANLREIFKQEQLEKILDCINKEINQEEGRIKRHRNRPPSDSSVRNEMIRQRCEERLEVLMEIQGKWISEVCI